MATRPDASASSAPGHVPTASAFSMNGAATMRIAEYPAKDDGCMSFCRRVTLGFVTDGVDVVELI
jgi:hypothetical protein